MKIGKCHHCPEDTEEINIRRKPPGLTPSAETLSFFRTAREKDLLNIKKHTLYPEWSMMNGVIIFHPAFKEKCYGHYCFFWTLEQLYHSFLRGCQKK